MNASVSRNIWPQSHHIFIFTRTALLGFNTIEGSFNPSEKPIYTRLSDVLFGATASCPRCPDLDIGVGPLGMVQ